MRTDYFGNIKTDDGLQLISVVYLGIGNMMLNENKAKNNNIYHSPVKMTFPFEMVGTVPSDINSFPSFDVSDAPISI